MSNSEIPMKNERIKKCEDCIAGVAFDIHVNVIVLLFKSTSSKDDDFIQHTKFLHCPECGKKIEWSQKMEKLL